MDEWFNEGKKQKTKLCHKVFSALKNKEKSKTKMFGCLSEKMLPSDMKQEAELGVLLGRYPSSFMFLMTDDDMTPFADAHLWKSSKNVPKYSQRVSSH